ncbi:aromatic ring-hydroxylating dioxygenase subunit alpha [Sphingomonas oligophenolica]|uniref:Aromatic ring-hydroxylating dioxygenase subunit alpha n=1 Tax=Sphingomonas oligophenolica TaxID=301154 RepID=A0ABU9YCX1_9SPHN
MEANAILIGEPPAPRVENERPETVGDILRRDSIPASPTLLISTEIRLGTAPLDARRYYSREFFDLENERMWPRVWQYAAWSYDIPNAGDVAVYRNAGRSVLIVRQRDNSIKAFANACLHRGRELCTETVQHRDELKCPYHGFTWSIDGSLKWIPCQWDFPQVKPETHKLAEVRCELWNGFVFINFDNDAPSLRDYMGKMWEQWESVEGWNFHNRFRAVTVIRPMAVNWKVCMEAFIEVLHGYESHPHVRAGGSDVQTQYDIWPDEPHFSRMHTPMGYPSPHCDTPPSEQETIDNWVGGFAPELADSPDSKLKPGETTRQAMQRLAAQVYKQRVGVDMSNEPISYLVDPIEYSIFPNFAPWSSLGSPIVYRFLPGDDPDHSTFEVSLYLPFTGERPASGRTVVVTPEESLASVPELGGLGFILQQDIDNLEPMQRGLKANITNKVTLAEYQEVRIRHYHQTIDAYLGDVGIK